METPNEKDIVVSFDFSPKEIILPLKTEQFEEKAIEALCEYLRKSKMLHSEYARWLFSGKEGKIKVALTLKNIENFDWTKYENNPNF